MIRPSLQLYQIRLVSKRQPRVRLRVGGIHRYSHARKSRITLHPPRVRLPVPLSSRHLRVNPLFVDVYPSSEFPSLAFDARAMPRRLRLGIPHVGESEKRHELILRIALLVVALAFRARLVALPVVLARRRARDDDDRARDAAAAAAAAASPRARRPADADARDAVARRRARNARRDTRVVRDARARARSRRRAGRRAHPHPRRRETDAPW